MIILCFIHNSVRNYCACGGKAAPFASHHQQHEVSTGDNMSPFHSPRGSYRGRFCDRDNLLHGCEVVIYLFLHQTTTCLSMSFVDYSCLSIYSYIKPQQIQYYFETTKYFTIFALSKIPTSYHNKAIMAEG